MPCISTTGSPSPCSRTKLRDPAGLELPPGGPVLLDRIRDGLSRMDHARVIVGTVGRCYAGRASPFNPVP